VLSNKNVENFGVKLQNSPRSSGASCCEDPQTIHNKDRDYLMVEIPSASTSSPIAATDPAETIPSDALSRLRGYYPSLSNSEKKVADFILEHFGSVIRMPLSELAQASGVSEATVVRLSRSLGYRGILELKLALTRELPNSPQLIHDDITLDDGPAAIARKVFQGAMRALNDTLAVLDEKAFARAVDLIARAERILIAGVGTSGPMAHEFYNRLMRLRFNAQVQIDSYLQVMQAALLTERDALVVISQSGDSNDPIRTAAEARIRGCPVIALTGNHLSPLAEKADVVLLTVSHETRPETLSSRVAQHTLIQALYVALAMRSIDETIRAEKDIWDALFRIPPYQAH
jgi:DNA-binding MurR/RpiR family transcriptional regulator